jgi:lysozyme
MNQRLSAEGLAYLKNKEGYSATPYKDIAGHWTIGFGHKFGVTPNDPPLTREAAEQVLKDDLRRFEDDISRSLTVVLEACQFDALVLFAYNLGFSRLVSSNILKMVNDGHALDAAKLFVHYDHITDPKGNKEVSKGLFIRRTDEANMLARPILAKKDSPSIEV